MSALIAVILSAMLSTPIVYVSHDRVIEAPRVAPHAIVAESGIDAGAVDSFVRGAALRYQGIQ